MAIALFESIRNDDWIHNFAPLTLEEMLNEHDSTCPLKVKQQWSEELKRWEANPEKLWPENSDKYFFTLKARVLLYRQLKKHQTDLRKEKSFVEYFIPPTACVPETNSIVRLYALNPLSHEIFYDTMEEILQNEYLPEEIREHTKGYCPNRMPHHVIEQLTPAERGTVNMVFLRTLAACIQNEYDSIFNTQPKMQLQTKIQPVLDQAWNTSYIAYGLAMSYMFVMRATNAEVNTALSLTTTFSHVPDDDWILIRREKKS